MVDLETMSRENLSIESGAQLDNESEAVVGEYDHDVSASLLVSCLLHHLGSVWADELLGPVPDLQDSVGELSLLSSV